MYNLDEKVSDESGNYFSVGIQQNVELKDITLEEASNGNPYIKFHFEGEKGEKIAHTEWPIDTSDENFEKKIKNFLKRIKHIGTKFVPGEKLNINSPDFEGFANQLIAMLKPNLTKTKVRLKLVYNYNDYVAVPKYLPFIEKMEIPAEKSRLKIDPDFDKMQKDQGEDPSLASGSAPASQTPAAGGGEGDSKLPF